MAPYYLYFFIAAAMALKPFYFDKKLSSISWALAIIFGMLFIGLRFQVGGDWLNYIASLRLIEANPPSFWLDISRFDIGYQIIAFLGSRFGLGIYGVNIICGFIVMTSLSYFAKRQPYPWLVMLLAIPFFIIGINMGTVRQGLALSISLVALTHLHSNSKKYLMWIALAFLFHKSAVVMLSLLVVKRLNFKALLISSIGSGFLFLLLSQFDAFIILIESYFLNVQYQSQGALIRVLVSLLPSLGLLLFYKQLRHKFEDIWIYACIAIGTLILLLMSSSFSTLVDRLAYYTIPLQLALWPRIIFVQKSLIIKQYFMLSVVLGYFAMLYVWLNFANHSWAWIPYQIVWFGENSINAQTLCLNGYCQ